MIAAIAVDCGRMNDTDHRNGLRRPRPPLGWLGFVLAFLVAVGGLLRLDVMRDADFVPARVVEVRPITGYDAYQRLALVEVGPELRVLRTRDRLVDLTEGGAACVRVSHFLLRAWSRHALVPLPFCRNLAATPDAGSLAIAPPDA